MMSSKSRIISEKPNDINAMQFTNMLSVHQNCNLGGPNDCTVPKSLH